LVFVNSFASADLILNLSMATSAPIICRAPELKSVVTEFCDLDAVRDAIPYVDAFIAVSGVVGDFMSHDLGIPPEKIIQIPGFHRPLGEPGAERNQIRKQLGMSDNTFLVCGCGTISHRKGVDLFLEIAAKVIDKSLHGEYGFVWVGGDIRSALACHLASEVERRELTDIVKFVGPKANPRDFYAASDLFALTSREDPFPLVVLEAASVGLPTVCFDGPVGSSEFVGSGCGVVVPHSAVDDFADAVLHLSRNTDQLRDFGAAASAAVQGYSYDLICERVFTVIEAPIARNSGNVHVAKSCMTGGV